MSEVDERRRQEVRDWYAATALRVEQDSSCCGTEGCGCVGYSPEELATLPAETLAASRGSGNPVAVADLREGDVVLDLGSGGGIDVLLAARQVGPTGRVYGLDMTDEMLALARRAAAEADVSNVEFLKGLIEAVPLPDRSVDVVVSNCVINLSTDKPAVLAEAYRVLRPGGWLGVNDVVAEDRLSPAERAERGGYVECMAGALSRSEYERALRTAGFADASVTFTSQVADGIHAADVRARKPKELRVSERKEAG